MSGTLVNYDRTMKTHQEIDARALELARRIVARIDADPTRRGVEKARRTCQRWQHLLPESQQACVNEWAAILTQPWDAIRQVLLDSSDEGNRRRQNSPFCGILTNVERWQLLQEFTALETELGSSYGSQLKERLRLIPAPGRQKLE